MVHPAAAGLRAFAPFVGGLLLGLAGLTVPEVLYFGGRFRSVVGVVSLTLGLRLSRAFALLIDVSGI